ncbi:hypothetical protein D3C71_1561060 [compost metagenome]
MVQAQFAFATDLGLLDVHVQAKAATVDLRGADVDQVAEFLDHGHIFHGRAEVHVLLGQLRRHLEVIQPLGHVGLP